MVVESPLGGSWPLKTLLLTHYGSVTHIEKCFWNVALRVINIIPSSSSSSCRGITSLEPGSDLDPSKACSHRARGPDAPVSVRDQFAGMRIELIDKISHSQIIHLMTQQATKLFLYCNMDNWYYKSYGHFIYIFCVLAIVTITVNNLVLVY